jgi:uncharacterized damage-inducible protein DinB
MFARYLREKNEIIYGILDALSNEEREKERGSYYHSLSGLLRHTAFGIAYFLGLFRASLSPESAAVKAAAGVQGLALESGGFTEAGWKEFKKTLDVINAALEGFMREVTEEELCSGVKVEWYGGKPADVPLSFLVHQLLVHNTHHEGQISQVLDEMKIDNNYSGINIAFL